MNLEINDKYGALLEKLAQERGKSSSELVEILIHEYDGERHIVWSGRQQAHVRVKCGYVDCFETVDRKDVSGGYRD